MILKKVSILFLLLACADLHAATFTVTTTSDTAPTGQPGELRWAIQQNNATAGLNNINFNVPGTGPFTIQPSVDLDAITNPVIIDGYTQPAASVNTDPLASNAVLMIQINGSNYTVGDGEFTGAGLTLGAGSAGSTVRGLAFGQWIGAGIFINGTAGGADGSSILGNFIGTNVAGNQQQANQAGVMINSANDTIVGSANPADRNVIAGSFASVSGAVFFGGLFAGAGISILAGNGTVIKGNLIGTDTSGSIALGRSQVGIGVGYAFSSVPVSDTVIGGITAAERNIISGQLINGIQIFGSSNIVQGNYIGTDVTGSYALGNKNSGIFIFAFGQFTSPNDVSLDNIIGNTGSGGGNLISGNGDGIILGNKWLAGSHNNSVLGNFIGTDASGTQIIGNTRNGVVLDDDSNIIGGPVASARNIISGNALNGILIYACTGSSVMGNYIGVDMSGEVALGNGANGVQLGLAGGLGAALNNMVGGAGAGQGNVISANGNDGVLITSFSNNNVIIGNIIGLSASQANDLPNGNLPIEVVCSTGNTIAPNTIFP